MLAGELWLHRSRSGPARSAGAGRRRPGPGGGQFWPEILLGRIDDAEVRPQVQLGRRDEQCDDGRRRLRFSASKAVQLPEQMRALPPEHAVQRPWVAWPARPPSA